MVSMRRIVRGLVCGSALFLSLVTGLEPALAASRRAEVTLLPDAAYGSSLLQRVRQARESIVFGYFLFKVTRSRRNLPRQLAEELIRARRRGVEVSVLLEQDRGGRDRLNDENRETADLLEQGGVRVRFDSPAVTTHVKAAVIDRRYVYLGSHNLTQSALEYNNELSVLIDSPAVAAEVLGYLNRL